MGQPYKLNAAQQENIRTSIKAGKGNSEIGREVGVYPSCIAHYRKQVQENYKPNPRRRVMREEQAIILCCKDKGLSEAAIAFLVDRSLRWVRLVCKKPLPAPDTVSYAEMAYHSWLKELLQSATALQEILLQARIDLLGKICNFKEDKIGK